MTQIIYPPKKLGKMKDLEFETSLPKARLAYILWHRFFSPGKAKSRTTIGRELGISPTRVMNLERNAIEKIKNAARFFEKEALSLQPPWDDD